MSTPRWNDGVTRWNSGARWQPASPPLVRKVMSKVALNVSKLPIADLIVVGADWVQKGTNNPNVPGNAAVLADFSTAQADLIAANAAYEAARQTCKQLMTARNSARAAWMAKGNALGAFTEVATGGDAEGIESAGFDVASGRTPTPLLDAPTNVRAETNGEAGHTVVSCDPLPTAKSYVVQKSNDPDAEEGWVIVATPTKATCNTNGVTPGTRVWYRMAGVNARGRGPFSEPTPRPVM